MKHKHDRDIVSCCYSVDTTIKPDFANSPEALKSWLAKQAQAHQLDKLLAHADDGVIWGRVKEGRLSLSSQVFPDVSPPLRPLTLQQARLFGKEAELLIWRDGDDKWRARLLQDKVGESQDQWRFDEYQLQWGDHQEGKEIGGFTLVSEGQEGLRHAVPLPAQEIRFDLAKDARDGRGHPIWLKVRHYLARDEDGMLIIVQSRLVKLGANGREEVSND